MLELTFQSNESFRIFEIEIGGFKKDNNEKWKKNVCINKIILINYIRNMAYSTNNKFHDLSY